MHILLTRPLEDCYEMILKFKNLGHQISHMPLISIERINHKNIDYSDFQGIIFTSSNAIKFLDLKKINKRTKCFCVGNATEKKARSFGFQNVFAAFQHVFDTFDFLLHFFIFLLRFNIFLICFVVFRKYFDTYIKDFDIILRYFNLSFNSICS